MAVPTLLETLATANAPKAAAVARKPFMSFTPMAAVNIRRQTKGEKTCLTCKYSCFSKGLI